MCKTWAVAVRLAGVVRMSCCSSGISVGGGGGSSGITQIDTGNTIWVDQVFGNDATGAVNRQDLPFITIMAALAIATPTTTVVVRPGVYDENVTMPTGVTMIGVSKGSTISASAGTSLTFNDPSAHVANMTITASGGGLGISAVTFRGTSLSTCTLADAYIEANAPAGITLGGTGQAQDTIINLDNVIIENTGFTCLIQDRGESRIRDCFTSGRFGGNIDRATMRIEDSRFFGATTGLIIGTTGIVEADPATRWNSIAIAGAGVLTYDGTGISPQYVPSNVLDWAGVSPVDVATALDRIAAALGPIP
jgi:hypothetical protein